MKAREIHSRHFRSSVGSVLNENYGGGRVQDSVIEEDYVYVPKLSLPLSKSALKFLEHKFPPTPAPRGDPPPTSESLYDAYVRATGQPQMMVHYDREPVYWQGKRKLEGRHLSNDTADILRVDDYRRGLVPHEAGPASTPRSIASSKLAGSGVKPKPASSGRGSSIKGTPPVLGPIEHNRHKLWTPGSEAAGFKPYSPFSEPHFDKLSKSGQYIPPEKPDSVRKTCDVIPAPQYSDALRTVLEPPYGTDVNMERLYGYPEYPDKVMSEKDVPHYVAWTKIFPYCPLSQLKDKPEFVPPRGFTPSTAQSQRPPSLPRSHRLKQLKAGVFQGQTEGGEISRGQGDKVPGNTEAVKNTQVDLLKKGILKGMPRDDQTPQSPKQVVLKEKTPTSNTSQVFPVSGGAGRLSALPEGKEVDKFEPAVKRRDIRAPDVWYQGQTPTHTPTPDYTLPIKPNRAWIKHYSPERVRKFLENTAHLA